MKAQENAEPSQRSLNAKRARNTLTKIGDTIRRARKDRDLTQAQLAETLAIGRSTLISIENGQPVESWALAVVMEELGLILSHQK